MAVVARPPAPLPSPVPRYAAPEECRAVAQHDALQRATILVRYAAPPWRVVVRSSPYGALSVEHEWYQREFELYAAYIIAVSRRLGQLL